MASVDIGSETYEAFGDVEGADVYLDGDALLAEPWGELDEDGKGRNIVTATRILVRQPWAELPTFSAPPAAVVAATYEFAGAIAAGYDLATDPASILQVRRQKAGSVEIDYFRDADQPTFVPPPLPKAVWDLIKPLLKAEPAAFLAGSYSSGTCGRSITESGSPYDGRYFGFGTGLRDFD